MCYFFKRLKTFIQANWDVKEAIKAVRHMRATALGHVNLWSKEEISSIVKCLRMENAMYIYGRDSTLELDMMRVAVPNKSRGELVNFLYAFGQNICHIDVYKKQPEILSRTATITTNVPKTIQSALDTTFTFQNKNFIDKLWNCLPQDVRAYIAYITNCYFDR